MNNKTKILALQYGFYALLFYLIYILQATPGVLSFWGHKPLLLAPCVVCVAMLEQELVGGLFGAFAGALCDLASNSYFGFHAILFLLCGTAVGLLCEYLTQRNLRNCIWFTAGLVAVTVIIGYFFQLGIYHYPGAGLYWLWRLLGTGLPTLAFTPLFYLLFSRLYSRFITRREA